VKIILNIKISYL